MLLLFNKALNYYTILHKKIQKKSVFGATADNFLPFLAEWIWCFEATL